MDWCQSPIPEAIQNAKIKGTMFLVYIYGTDEQSEQMNVVWDNETVSGWIKESGAIAVRIQSSSEECKFFSQIYPVVCVPSTYCIGDGGIPLEVIGGHKTSAEFVDKLRSAQQNHESRKNNSASSAATGSIQETMEVSESPPVQETSPSNTSEVTAPGQAGSSSLQTGPSGDKAENLTHSEKVERAKELIAKKQAEKAQKEFEKSREEEINRRKLGKDMHKLKQTQQEMQMKEMKEQMKKEKEEERKAREKIRAQIAKDREERASRFKKEKEEREVEMEQAKKAKLVEQQKQAAEAEAKKRMDSRKVYTCTICSKTFSRKYRMNFHIKNVHANMEMNTKCSYCNKKFSTVGSKQRHVNIVHRMVTSFSCEDCNKIFSHKGNLEAHNRAKHGATKLQCMICLSKFSYRSTLKEHEINCTGNEYEKFTCTECRKSYKHKRSLDAHVTSKHRGKSHVCEFCGEQFSFGSSLRKHKKRKHKQ